MKRDWHMVLAGVLLVAVFLGTSPAQAPAQPQLPPSKEAPRVGDKAPDFTLPNTQDKPFKLSELFSAPAGDAKNATKPAWVLLVFYRGYW